MIFRLFLPILAATVFFCFGTVSSSEAKSKTAGIDKRIVESRLYRQLVSKPLWEIKTSKRTDAQEQTWFCVSGISSTPGGWDARRARNLAANRHYAEAINEITNAIANYDEPKKHKRSLDPDWLLFRAKLYRHVGMEKAAMADVLRVANLKRNFGGYRFKSALALIDFGKYAEAEAVLKPAIDPRLTMFRSYFCYLLAFAQERQGKTKEAIENYRTAGNIYAATAEPLPAEACLDAIASIDKSKRPTGFTPPSANIENIKRLIKALVTSDDAFNIDKLKILVGAKEFKETKTFFTVTPYKAHFKEISMVAIRKLRTGGKHMEIRLDPVLCCVDKSAYAPFVGENILLSQNNKGREGYEVPSGTITFSMLGGEFKPIKYIELYSKEAASKVPGLKPKTKIASSIQKPKVKFNPRYLPIYQRGGNLANAEEGVKDWIKDEPESPRAHMWMAEIQASKKKYGQAIKSINIALKYKDKDKNLDSRYTGNVLLIKRAGYYIKQKKFKEALADLKEGFPAKLNADHYLLRGKAQLGLKKYKKAQEDLEKASEQFYRSSRIVRRDETLKLLKSIPGYKRSLVSKAVKQKKVVDSKKYLEKERKKTLELLKASEEDRKQKREAKIQKQRKYIEDAKKRLMEAEANQHTRPYYYIRALLNLASRQFYQEKKEEARKNVDKALDVYETYTPKSPRGTCIRELLNGLRYFDGDEKKKRLDRVVRISEKFCNDKRMRRSRDNEFLRTRIGSLDKIKLLEKIISVREELKPKTDAPVDQLYRNLASAYRNKGDFDKAKTSINKALEKSPNAESRAYCHIFLANLYAQQNKYAESSQEWKKAGEAVEWKLSRGTSRSLLYLAKYYRQHDQTDSFNALVSKVIEHANKDVIKEFDSIFRERLKDLIAKQKFSEAEALIKKRIGAGEKSMGDKDLDDWQIKLSELYLVTGRQKLSEELFQKVRKSLILKGESPASLDIRRKLILKRTGLIGGTSSKTEGATSVKSITFPYALYAFSKLSLCGNTIVRSFDSSLGKQAVKSTEQANGDICSPGTIKTKGSTLVFGTIYGTVPAASNAPILKYRQMCRTKLVKEASELARSVMLKSSEKRIKLGDYKPSVELKGGDYEATSINGSVRLHYKLSKPVRIFLTDDSTNERYAIKVRSLNNRLKQPANLQIWYQGYRPIKFEHNSDINAVIYAPYSTVTMGDNNCTFRGALVADKINAIGNVHVEYDRSLKSKKFVPSEASVSQ